MQETSNYKIRQTYENKLKAKKEYSERGICVIEKLIKIVRKTAYCLSLEHYYYLLLFILQGSEICKSNKLYYENNNSIMQQKYQEYSRIIT